MVDRRGNSGETTASHCPLGVLVLELQRQKQPHSFHTLFLSKNCFVTASTMMKWEIVTGLQCNPQIARFYEAKLCVIFNFCDHFSAEKIKTPVVRSVSFSRLCFLTSVPSCEITNILKLLRRELKSELNKQQYKWFRLLDRKKIKTNPIDQNEHWIFEWSMCILHMFFHWANTHSSSYDVLCLC